ncbi:SGNH/GDSL hydrolase family protein [Coralliovum pocilloporae]|uniref:SGNH/GDSL hydrolase family protein n=1 Tax=Coralliovum pocilloporae TaxID=3066369 RepID=UPI003307AD80
MTSIRVCVMLVVFLSAFAGGVGVSFDEVQAQQKERRSLFSIIFGTRKSRKVEPKKQTKKKVRSGPVVPKIIEAAKNPDAYGVLVVGDLHARQLADALKAGFAKDAGVRVIRKTRNASGFARKSVVDWPIALVDLLDNNKVDFVIIMSGMNDRRSIRDEAGRHKFKSPEWQALYEAEIHAFRDILEDRKIRYRWVSSPPVSTPDISADMAYLNDIYKTAIRNGSGRFVDIWPYFLDENSKYSSFGPDLQGQRKRLRTKDGIGFSWAGAQKMSYFVERQIRRSLFAARFLQVALPDGLAPEELAALRGERKLPYHIQSLNGFQSKDGDELAGGDGGTVDTATLSGSAKEFFVDGKPPAPRKGRVDDYTLLQ